MDGWIGGCYTVVLNRCHRSSLSPTYTHIHTHILSLSLSLSTISLNEFSQGLRLVDIDLERPDYLRLYKAVDETNDRSVTLEELKKQL